MGRSFHGVGMLAAQQRFAAQLLETVAREQVDVVLVSGDVYDRALPGVDVVSLLDSLLADLSAAGVAVVLTSGNHDSATRLGFAGRVMSAAGIHLRTRIADLADPVLFELDGGRLAVYGLPFLEPRLAAGPLEAADSTHFAVTEAALARVRADLATRPEGTQVVVMSHTFASGGITSASERELSIGGLGAVPLDLFDGFAYTALGHLHGRQILAPNVRYSGSPLPYSFSEANHSKGAWLVDIDASGVQAVTPVEWAADRRLAVLRGPLEELLADEGLAWAEGAYCQIKLTDNDRPAQAMERLRERFPDTLVLGFEPENAQARERQSYSSRVASAGNEIELCCGFLDHVRSRPASPGEEAALARAVESARMMEAAL